MRDGRGGGGMAGRERSVGEEHREMEVALDLMQGLLGAGCTGTALGCARSPALAQQLRLQDWVLWLSNPVLPVPGHWAAWEWSVVPPPSYLQQAHQGGGEDDEAGQHVCGRLPGGGEPDEDVAAQQAGEAARRRHQGGAHLHHHRVHGERCCPCPCTATAGPAKRWYPGALGMVQDQPLLHPQAQLWVLHQLLLLCVRACWGRGMR